jgi:hypothetical protein
MDRKTEALAPLVVTAQMIAARPANIRDARISGAKWGEIADALGMSQSQVIELAKK